MPYIFLDESGQFSNHSRENYFVVASFTAQDVRQTAKGFRAWCHSHFPRKMRDQSEIKWSSTRYSDELRLKTLRKISKLDVRIRFVYLSHQNIPLNYRHKNKLRGGLLYTNIVVELLALYLPDADKEFRVFCDRRRLSGMSEAEFKETIKVRLMPTLSKNAVFQVEMVDSASSVNIQIADWISGAIARYLEKGHLGKECFKILQGNIIGEAKELFKGEAIL
jgi:hypothetical protein